MGSWESTGKQHCKMVQLKSTVEQLGCCRTAEDSSWNTGEIGQLKSTVEKLEYCTKGWAAEELLQSIWNTG